MQVRCTVQLEASFAAAAVGAIILLLSPFMMTLTVAVLTHSIHMLRPWFSSMLRIIIIVVDGLNMIQISVMSGAHVRRSCFPMRDAGSPLRVSTGDRWPRISAILTILASTV